MAGSVPPSPRRAVVHIDRARCLGCGQCLGSCPKGLLVITGQYACLADADRCDGRGACLGHCSADALSLRPLPTDAGLPIGQGGRGCEAMGANAERGRFGKRNTDGIG